MIANALRNKIAWSTLVQYFGKVLQIVLGIAAVKIATNALGAEQFGLAGKIAEYALFFSVAANLGIFGNTVRKMADHPKDGEIFVNAMFVRLGTGILFLGSGALYALLFIDDPIFQAGVLFFMSALFLDFATSICTGMLQANYMMGRSVFAITLGRAMEILILLQLAAHLSPATYFLAPLAGSIVALSLSLGFVRMRIRLKWTHNWDHIKLFLFSAIPFGIINIFNNLYFRFLPDLFASKALTEEQFSHFHLSNVMAQTAAIFSTFLMFSILPSFKASLEDKKYKQAHELYNKARLLLLGLAIITIIGGTALGPFALKLISGPEFYQAALWYVIPALFLLASISFFYDLVLITLFAQEKDVWFLKREVLALSLAGCFFLLSLLPKDPHARMSLVLLGALLGESLIVGLSLRKIRSEFGRSSKD